MFIEDENGHLHAVSAIKTLSRDPSSFRSHGTKDKYVRITLIDDKVVNANAYDVRRFLDSPKQVFPAQPDTYLLGWSEDDPDDVWKTLIIGWGVSQSGCINPITVDGVNDGVDNPGPVQTPDGKVTDPMSRSWPTIVDWIAHMKAESAKTS